MLTYPKCYAFCMKVEKGGPGLKDVLRYMEMPYETWESVGQMSWILMKKDFYPEYRIE
ncbi:hypothetical protein [Mediterraneibacter gnavus]|uniref:hypothetical protein n=1 Tax=Mediterraneibacter gnavus TaxID=33038 RepID=UPI0034B255D2